MSALTRIEELAARQGRLSDVRRRSKEVPTPGARRAEGPWIAVSRQAGSQGSELAVAVARSLGFRAYDREILTAIAERTRSSELALRRVDERAVSQIDEYLAPLIVPDDPGRARYLVEMTRIIGRLARQGRAVFVGRGAKCFLDPACGLRVRAIGSFDARVAEVSRARSLTLQEARHFVSENDAAQRAFIRQSFRKDIDDPAGFDLVVNVPDMGLPAAVEAVIAAAKAKLSL